MKYLSVCSGIEAASAAWHSLGWRPVGFSEIEPFPCSVLEHRFPDVTNFGDMTKFEEWPIEPGSIDVLVGGTPCQSFSIAGLRGGLKDGRGNLALTYCRIVQKLQPKWFVWENVPGVLSSNSGRDFGSIVGAMAELGYGLAYRVLDAQYFGVPQRRRRVFIVGCAGDWRRAAAVLFESGCVSGDSQKGGKKKQDVAGTLASRTTAGGGLGTDFDLSGGLTVGALMSGATKKGHGVSGVNNQAVAAGHVIPAIASSTGSIAHCLNAGGMGRQDYETETMIACTLPASDGGVSSGYHPVIAIQERAVSTNIENGPQGAGFRDDGKAYTLEARNKVQAVAFTQNQRNEVRELDVIGALQAQPGMKQQAYLSQSVGVRRLTPRECERLQGFPDDWTLVPHRGKPAADGPRYKAIGNSMAVPVMRWIGKRIELVKE
jgi:DNA (cytosine-5)-methyltransferase 1